MTKLISLDYLLCSLISFLRSEYEYTFLVKHSPDSQADARGVHVTWMLTPFVKISKVTSSSLVGSYRVEQKDDSVTFKAGLFYILVN